MASPTVPKGLRIDLATIMQALVVAELLWFGNKMVTVSETVAVHEFRLKALEQTERLALARH